MALPEPESNRPGTVRTYFVAVFFAIGVLLGVIAAHIHPHMHL